MWLIFFITLLYAFFKTICAVYVLHTFLNVDDITNASGGLDLVSEEYEGEQTHFIEQYSCWSLKTNYFNCHNLTFSFLFTCLVLNFESKHYLYAS